MTLPKGMEARQQRAATFDRATVDAEARTAILAFSSEAPVLRHWGEEVLGHDPGDIETGFIGGGTAPLLLDHNARDLVGVVESVDLGADRKMRAVVRFGKSARASEVLQDVADGIRCNVSVGYEILDATLTRDEKGKPPAYRCRWKPFEVSLVSIPADSTVGVGREAEAPAIPSSLPSIPAEVRSSMSETITHAPATPEQIGAAAAKRATEIMELASLVNNAAAGADALRRGLSVEQFRGELVLARGEGKPLQMPAAQIGLSEKEVRSFSLSRFLLARAENNPALAPFEVEASNAAAQRMMAAGMPASRGGAILPYDIMAAPLPGMRMADGRVVVGGGAMQRDLSTASAGAGGNLVGTDFLATSFVELLRNAMMVRAMGATVLSGLQGNVAIPRQSGSATAGWTAQAAAGTEGDATYAQVTLAPKTVHAIQDYTRELLLQGSPDVEGLVRADLATVVALAVDLAALHGTGASNQPTGLAATSGIGSVAGGTNGAAPTWDNVVDLETQVAVQNAALGRIGYLTNAKVRGKLKRTPIVSGQPVFIWGGMPGDTAGADAGFGVMNGYRAGVSNQVSAALTKGTASGIASAVFFGNWADLLIGEWGGLELLTDNLTQAANRVVRVHAYQSADVAVRRAASFAAMLDALTA